MDALLESGTKEELTEFLRATAVSPARPWNILCITFTNKAAGEFKQRLETMLGPAAKDIWAGTFHSICVRMLRQNIHHIGSLTQPLFNRGANIANLKTAQIRQEEAKLLFQHSLLNAGKEVNDALTAWQTAKSQLEINARQVETLCDAVRKTESLMRHSNITYLEVLTAQQSLLEAEVQQLQTRFERIQSVIKLYHALGGGRF